MSEITSDLDKVVAALLRGEVAAIPTETVYGLAALASHQAAVAQVYALKQRPTDHPLIMHVAKQSDLSALVAFVSPIAKQLMDAFWPGPLTLVFKAKEGAVPGYITGGQTTVAIRCPASKAAQQILKAVGSPLVAPSANPFGKLSPTTPEHVQAGFPEAAFYIYDGGRCSHGIESTIVSVVDPLHYQVLRPGAMSETALKELVAQQAEVDAKVRVSGQLKQHYQPQKPAFAFENEADLLKAYLSASKPIYVLAFEANDAFDSDYFYQLPNSPEQLAYELYYQLHIADKSDAQSIYIALPPAKEAWKALRDRLLKAVYQHQ